MPRRFHLAYNLSYTHMNGRWRLPGAWDGRVFPDVTLYEDVARLAERGLLDMLFSGDGTGVPDTWEGKRDAAVRHGVMYPRVDMNPVMVAASRVTKHIGFGLTYSTTFMHPYYLARLMTSLDLLTNGRIAMNLVTSTRRSDAANFGFDQLMEHGSRYDRMEEFVAVCRKLWDATEADAMLWDADTGEVADPTKVHDVDHAGAFFRVQGPLNTPPSPQGHPVIVQAGGSPRGVRASAVIADHIFGADMPLQQQVRQRAELDAALLAAGRDPAGVGILWQTPMVVRETTREARAVRDLQLTCLTPEGARAYLSYHAGYDFSTLPQRFTLRQLRDEIAATQASPMGLVLKLALKLGEDTEITRDDFFEQGLLSATQAEHTIAGTPAEIADILEDRFEATGSRGGFMIGQVIAVMADLAAIVELLIPELQRRGRFRTAYEGRTLRETLSEP
jgi:FMN-dependent oxidoreductase (nitrilotriacetate monooxygenase family)